MKKYVKVTAIAFMAVMLFLLAMSQSENTPVFSHIVREMGYDDVETLPYEVVEFTIPTEFNRVYERYNSLLKEGGYNLEKYKGKTCKRYTYLIPSVNARANIIVYEGKIIGGDICGITVDGIMLPIKKLE